MTSGDAPGVVLSMHFRENPMRSNAPALAIVD